MVPPAVSDIPYKLNRGIVKDAKYSTDVFFKGAAPKQKTRHLSNPIAFLIVVRIKLFAILKLTELYA